MLSVECEVEYLLYLACKNTGYVEFENGRNMYVPVCTKGRAWLGVNYGYEPLLA